MAFPENNYAPPGVYTQTNFESPVASVLTTTRIPVLIGEGSEILSQSNLSVVRGSSSTVDQQVVEENEAGRAVVSISAAGAVTLGNFDGLLTRFQVRNFPITNGDGTGTTTNSRNSVIVKFNGSPVVVQSVDGTRGIITLAQAPLATDVVTCTYYFHRGDTLFTDNVSEQITPDNAILYGAVGVTPTTGNFTIVAGSNTFIVTVQGSVSPTTITVSLPVGSLSAAVVANTLTASVPGLTASTFINNFGLQCISLQATSNILLGNGTANGTLGFISGQATSRNKVFYTFQGPIVDGSGGGIITTDPSKVVAKINNVQVIPTAVNGTTRAVTLPYAPPPGATVTLTYWQNTWQDTFDYLANVGVSAITQVGATPNRTDYYNEADYVLFNDTIVWGTAFIVGTSTTAVGSTAFGPSQVSGTLVDYEYFAALTTPLTSTTFQLPYQPTTGNGRNSPLGQSLFNSVSNGRIDLPTDRPDLVTAYWGYSLQDALQRGAVTVASVDSATSTITLLEPVPAGASVWATFYYNLLVDKEYLLTVVLPGVGGVGTYTVSDADGNYTYSAFFNPNTKSAALTGITINFPSGSEYNAGVRFQGSLASTFVGPVPETVTVTFDNRAATPAAIAVSGGELYGFVEGASNFILPKFDASSMTEINLADPNGGLNAGIQATLVGSPVVYDDNSAPTGGTSYTLDATNNVLVVDVDGVQLSATVNAGASKTVADFANFLNQAGTGFNGTATGGTGTTLTDIAAALSTVDGYYIGWEIIAGTDPGLGVQAGQLRTITGYAYNSGTGVSTFTVDSAWTAGGGASPANNQTYYIYNPANEVKVHGSTVFANEFEVDAANPRHHQLEITYAGDSTTYDTTVTLTIPTGVYTVTQLASQLNAQLAASGGFNAADARLPVITVSATPQGQLQFKFRRGMVDTTYAVFYFGEMAAAINDFAAIAGLDGGGAATPQAVYYDAPFARAYSTTTGAGNALLYDRLVIRGRVVPGFGNYSAASTYDNMAAFNVLSQCGITVLGGAGNTKAGLTTGQVASATNKATIQPASVRANLPLTSGQFTFADAARGGEYAVTFYDGSGANGANNEFEFTVDGVFCSVTFAASGAGTLTSLGDNTVQSTAASCVISQINTALANLAGAPFGAIAAVRNSQMVRRDGAGLRITSRTTQSSSSVVIGSGSANAALGFTTGTTAVRSMVSASQLVSALMADTGVAPPVSAAAANTFAGEGVAQVVSDVDGIAHLYLESNSIGTTSRIEFMATTSTFSALRQGTGLNESVGTFVTGEAAINGFFVTSSNPSGSGSANTSYLNNGTGQDGTVGQTYVDDVTGLTFTILPRAGALSYPSGGTFRIACGTTFTCDGNAPAQIPGVELLVTNTLNTAVGNVATASTFKRGGQEPAIGDVYYVSYNYNKQDFTPTLFSKVSTIEQAFGPVSPDNPVSLAAYLAILNGAVLVGIAQTRKEPDSDFASVVTYAEVLDSLNTPLPGNIKPDIIVPLRGNSTEFFQYLSRNVSVQSSIRYQNERTAIIGMAAGTTPSQVQTLAQLLGNTRMRIVYPDTVTLILSDAIGNRQEYLVEGYYMAAAMAGNRAAPAVDVATPWTNSQLVGFTQLGRKLDAVQQNQTAIRGVTILEDAPPFLRVRHGLTTDMTNILTKLPTIVQIADYVQQNSRQVLANFIGIKFLPGVLSQIEGRLAMMFKQMVAAQIVNAYTGIKANIAPDDPTVANVEAFYQPVFPLLYIVITFNLRSSLSAQ